VSSIFALLHVHRVDCENTFEVGVILELFKSTKRANFSILENAYAISQVQEVDRMGDKNACFVLEYAKEYLLENFLAHISIQGRNGIVCHNDITVCVDGAGQADSSLLAARKVDTSLADFSLMTSRQNLEVALELASSNGFIVALGLVWLAKQYILDEA